MEAAAAPAHARTTLDVTAAPATPLHLCPLYSSGVSCFAAPSGRRQDHKCGCLLVTPFGKYTQQMRNMDPVALLHVLTACALSHFSLCLCVDACSTNFLVALWGAESSSRAAEDESHVGFHEVSKVVGVNRGFGLWGDMVITLSTGDKLELRSIPECAPPAVAMPPISVSRHVVPTWPHSVLSCVRAALSSGRFDRDSESRTRGWQAPKPRAEGFSV